ncbi:hypothetical protein N7535_008135 [Penicillium sp. DV-2018c]|nr:hypothetical protein N7461_004171 [Penicillium sp. DV-2018c]KAJ5566497.1 hypothetical protein N7535_008135 [Penicillium sp. DV-2018c]
MAGDDEGGLKSTYRTILHMTIVMFLSAGMLAADSANTVSFSQESLHWSPRSVARNSITPVCFFSYINRFTSFRLIFFPFSVFTEHHLLRSQAGHAVTPVQPERCQLNPIPKRATISFSTRFADLGLAHLTRAFVSSLNHTSTAPAYSCS